MSRGWYLWGGKIKTYYTHSDSQVIPPLFTTKTSFPLESEVGKSLLVNNNNVVPETEVNGYKGVKLEV